MDDLDSGLGGPNGRPDVVVRRAGPEEWRELRDVRLRALAEAPYAFGSTYEREAAFSDDQWRERAARPDSVTVVAEHQGRFVGCASGTRAMVGTEPVEGSIAALLGMWVEPGARGSGIAERIVEAVEDWAREADYESIGLGVTVGNDRAIAFYRRIGYVDTGQRLPLRPRGGAEIAIMVKQLA